MSYPTSYPSGYQPEDYTQPIDAPTGGRPGWIPSSPLADTLFGQGYVNEGDPTWEEVITMVVIPGNPQAIYEAAGSWQVVFSRVQQAQAMLDQLNWSLQNWTGPAADTYKQRLTGISQDMAVLMEQHRPVIDQLQTAGDNLQNALVNTPIPDDMVDQVMDARRNYADNGTLDTNRWRPGAIFDFMFPIMSNRWLSEVGSFLTFGFTDWVTDKLRDWLTDEDDKARAAYRQLANQHVSTMQSMPQGQSVMSDDVMARTVTPSDWATPTAPSSAGTPSGFGTSLAGAGGAGGPTTVPGSGPGTGLGTAGGLASSGGIGGVPAGVGAGGAGNVTMPGSSSAASAGRGGMMGGMPVGGMAGAQGAGAGGRTSAAGARGIGGMPMGGMPGAAGAGAAGAGRGVGGGKGGALGTAGAAAGGRAGMPGMGGMPMGAAGAAGAGAAGAGRGAGAGRAGMVGGAPAGHGNPEDGETHSTWLNEDEDVWGSDSDAPPSVLGG